jgi:hypothetical protein
MHQQGLTSSGPPGRGDGLFAYDPAFRIRQPPGNVSEGSVVSRKKQATFGTLTNSSLGGVVCHA